MYTFIASIPAAAVRRETDGKLYAYSDLHLHTLPGGKITVCHKERGTRLLRVDDVHPTNGTASVFIGKAGDAIAATSNLPFSVTAVYSQDKV